MLLMGLEALINDGKSCQQYIQLIQDFANNAGNPLWFSAHQ